MEKIGLNELRTLFLEFYRSKDHYVHESFSLIPHNDKSLLIINSGMAPLKPYFAGIETPPAPRMTTCQKCIRTGDIDNVGHTARHGTFFEMLGSFSFGDYFKEQSLKWGWEFITEVLKMPPEKLWATIFEDDDEAFEIWNKVIGMPADHIVRLGRDDNFWQIGIGPCGPCSEIYFDRGPAYGCGKPDCKPGCDCDRYVEFWNHVFSQFNADENNNYTPLEHKNIDTGLGLERLACIMQDTDSIFAIDTIRHILEGVVAVSGVAYEGGSSPSDVSIRIITDHIRSVTFMIGDGILPSNEGRGYVLRRLLRRAARHGKLLGIEGPFLADLSARVVEVSGDAYPEIRERQDYIHRILSIEEEKFSKTIDQGMAVLLADVEELKASGAKVLSGDKVFRLYDTFGFPIELTQEILSEQGFGVDEAGFQANMEKQKETARSARRSDMDEGWADEAALYADLPATEFLGYEQLEAEATVLAIFSGGGAVDSLEEGESGRVIFDRSPLYAEMGGQATDTGAVESDAFRGSVEAVSKVKEIFVHRVTALAGSLQKGDKVSLRVDLLRRNETARNHTATHILHAALRQVLGTHVEQAGSSVTGETLRFDFTHFEAISAEDLAKIEALVNEKISSFLPVHTDVMSIEEAHKTGAMSLFGEKYGATVRVVSVGDFSREFCGGTHLSNAGQIGAFKILSESSVAAGVRRIEAVTGLGVYRKLQADEALLKETADALKCHVDALGSRAKALSEEMRAAKKEVEELKKQNMASLSDDLGADTIEIKGVKLLRKRFDSAEYELADLRSLCDEIRAKQKATVIVFALESADKVSFLVSLTDDLQEKGYHAGKMIKEIAAAAGGGGGGKADMAQAGAKDPSKIEDAFKVAETLL